MSDYRVYVEKKPGFATEAASLLNDLNETLHLPLSGVRVINVYDVFGVTEAELETVKNEVLAEIVTDEVTTDPSVILRPGAAGSAESRRPEPTYFGIEFLPGQYDQRADSAMQCLSLLCGNDDAIIKSGKIIVLESASAIYDADLTRIKKYLINPVESREKDLSASLSLDPIIEPAPVPVIKGFINLDESRLERFLTDHGMAMSLADLQMIQGYFRHREHRDPTETELKVLDTYWSDHCRHTTFETIINDVKFEPGNFQETLQRAFNEYLEMRSVVEPVETTYTVGKPITLMDMATIAAKEQRKLGLLDDLEVSDEINACSIYIDVDVDGDIEPWLLMFKNETHNHPTEIEPFGGASTCIGGAIRDPLSGRSYVYQAMRISGGADISEPIEATLPGKLPQKVIAKGAAHGNSSYGNQIGLATSFVREFFHDGYKAKHLEVGAVVGAVPAADVKRLKPVAGDVILLLGAQPAEMALAAQLVRLRYTPPNP